MQLLAAMKPKFLRLPGGNYLEGNAFNDRFNWKETIGAGRTASWPSQPLGLLVHRRLRPARIRRVVRGSGHGTAARRFCRLLPRTRWRRRAGSATRTLRQEALEEIEYLTGDAKPPSGARSGQRTGIPSPSSCTMWRSATRIGSTAAADAWTYEGRFAQFYDAIKEKYPQLQGHFLDRLRATPSLWVKSRTPDLVDEHYYRGSQENAGAIPRNTTHIRGRTRPRSSAANGPRALARPRPTWLARWATRHG